MDYNNLMVKKAKRQINVKFLITVITVCFILSFYFVYWSASFIYVTESKESTSPMMTSSGSVIKQIIPNYPGHSLNGVGVCIGTYARQNSGIIQFDIYADQTLVEKMETDSSVLQDKQFHQFMLSKPLILSPGVEYSFSISQVYEGDNGIAFWTNTDDVSGFMLDGEEQTGILCFTMTCENKPLKNKALITSLVVLAILIAMFMLRMNELKVMACVLTILLVIYMSVFPIGSIADETHHFFRAFEIANGGMISKNVGQTGSGGDILPRALYSYRDNSATIDWNDTSEITFPGASLYAPLTYLPQAIGIRLAELFTDNVSDIYHTALYASTLLCLILCVAALYLAPFGRKVMFIILLFPMTLEEMASISPDGMTISLSFFFLAYITHLAYVSNKIRPRDIILIILSGTILSMCKIIYVVLLLLIFLIPDTKFESRKSALLLKFGLVVTAGLLNIIWLKIASRFLIEIREGVNGIQQVLYILKHPLDFYQNVIRTTTVNLDKWTGMMIGSALGALNIGTVFSIWLCFAALYIVTVCDSTIGNIKVRQYDAAIMILIFFVGYLLVLTSLYVQWTSVGNLLIEGVQGRYFTPLLGVLSFGIIVMRSMRKDKSQLVQYQEKAGLCYYVLVLCLNGMALMNVLKFFHLKP